MDGDKSLLLFLASPHVGVHHLAYNGPWPDDGHLYHQVIEFVRVIARQRGHLRPAFHLEHAHCIGSLQGFLNEQFL